MLMKQNANQAEFMLSIYFVKLAVKFPCRMSLHQDGKPITTEVQPVSNVFNFNQQITIKVNIRSDVEINAYLSTGKGGSILAGLISISAQALAAKEGSRFALPLQKCIDTAATAEIKVNHAWVPQDKPAVNITRSSAGGVFMRSNSPPARQKQRTQNDQVETRSEYQPQTPRRAPTVMVGGNLLIKQKQLDQKRFPNKDLGNTKISFKYDYPEPFEQDIRQTKTIGGTGTRYRKQKDKQRMQKLAAKKITDETQNNLKLDVMKYKMKSQQMQKSVAEKVKTIKQLKDQLLEHERKNIEKAYIQQQLASKQNSIKILQDRIQNLNTENINFRQTIAQHMRSISQLKQNIRFDLLKNKEDYSKKEEVLRVQLTDCKGKIVELEMDIANKSGQLTKAKKYIEDLESAAEHKIFQHDRLIQELKKQQNQALKQLNKRISQYEIKIEQLQKQISNKSTNISQLKDSIIKLQQIQRSYEQKTQTLEIEKTELLAFKADFQSLTKRYTKLEEVLKEQQRNAKKALDSKSKELLDTQQINNKNLKALEVKISSANDKIKEHKTKIQQLEASLGQSKNQEDKLKKLIEKQEKYIQQLTGKLQQAEKEAKSQEYKLQNLEKQFGEKSNNSNHMESLYKIQLQHSKESVAALTKDLDEVNFKYSKTRESLQLLRNQKSKLENKIQLMEDNATRLNDYIKQKKIQYDAKEAQFKENIKNLNITIRTMEEADKNKQKDINAWEIKDLTSKNKIDKLERSLEQANHRIEKMQKVTIVKLNEEKEKLQVELENTKIKLSEVVDENKLITGQRVKFESQSNKNNKINSVLNEEKIAIMNELNKSKNNVQRLEKNEQKLTNELKSANEQIKKLTIKIETLDKELFKNKQILNDTMNSIFTLKKSMKDSLNMGDYQIGSSNNIRGKNAGQETLRKKQSYIENLASSRVISSFNSTAQVDIKRISQILESTSKEQQNTIMLQQQTITHYKENIEKLEKELSSLSFSSQANQNKLQEIIDGLNLQLESTHESALNLTNNYEDKIAKLETEINKKQKDAKLNKSTINSLKYELETLKKKLQILIEESDMKQHKGGQKIGQLINECNFLQSNIKTLQTEKRSLETRLYSLEEDLSIQKQQRTKKEKSIIELTQKLTILRMEFQQLNKVKKENLQELLALRQEVESVKQSNEKTLEMLKTQERNNKKLQDFINELIKQKQNIVKVELQSSSKAIEMEGTVLQMKNILENKDELIKQKEEQIGQCKNTIKNLQGQLKNLETDLKQYNNRINILNSKIDEKQRKIQQKQNQLKECKIIHANYSSKSKQEIKILKQEYEMLQKRAQTIEQQKDSKIFSLEKHTIELQTQIQSLSNELTQKEELIFFEKQRSSLSESIINDMKKGQSEINLVISKYEQQITELNQELTFKEETLYEYSGKIYHLEQKLQAKEAEIGIREEKVDMDWQCRHDQICEEYEQKIEVLEKDKKYLKDKLDVLEQDKAKLTSQRQKFSEQFQKDMGSVKAKEKQLQEQKLQQSNIKNKQIQSLKNEIAMLNTQVKNSLIEVKKKQNQIANKDEVIKKLEVRIHENDRGSGSLKKQYQQQINNMKKNENAIKALKEEIKNAQWVTERQVKKITQVFIQRVVNCFPEGKQKLVEPIRALENSMSSVINFKL